MYMYANNNYSCFPCYGHSLSTVCWLPFPQDVVIKVVTGLAFFCGGIPLAVHSNEWRFWLTQAETPEENRMFNIGGITSTTSAAAVSGFIKRLHSHTCMCMPL